MRRKQGTLIPLEEHIIKTALTLQQQGQDEFYGYDFAEKVKDADGATNGTLYRALLRLEDYGILSSRFDDSVYPRRKYYRLVKGNPQVEAVDKMYFPDVKSAV